MSDIGTAILGDYIRVKHGFAFKGEYFTEAGLSNPLLVTPGNVAVGGGFQHTKPKHYAGPVPDDYVLETDDLVVSMTDLSKAGDTLGYPALIPAAKGRSYLHNQRIGLVEIKNRELLDKRFLFYRLRADDYRNHILATASGSTVRHTSPGRICEFKLRLPTIEIQKAIASLLGSLDEKIIKNDHTAEVLDSLAQAIFRAWFIDFEPVKAKASGAISFPSLPGQVFDSLPSSLVESAIGLVPEGWQIAPLTTLFEINPPRSLGRGQLAPHLDMKNMPTQGHAPDEFTIRPFGSGAKFSNGDTLVARITPCLENGKTAFVDFLEDDQVAWGSTEYIVMRPQQPFPPIFAYLLARTNEFRSFAIQAMTGTSGRQRVPFSALQHFQIATPSSQSLSAFSELVNPLIELSSEATRESRSLIKLRDSLLPRLLSGQFRVRLGETS